MLEIATENNTQPFDQVISTLSSQVSVMMADELTADEKQNIKM